MKRTFLFATIASILSINAYAVSATVTSKDYVDTQDALKQDKITAGTTGNVVLYNGTSNGQTQFTGRAIFDGSDDYDETTDANKLITAGAVSTMTPELPIGQSGYVVTYDSNGEIGGQLAINDQDWWNSDGGAFADNPSEDLVNVGTLRDNTVIDSMVRQNGTIILGLASTGAVAGYAQRKKTCAGWMDGTTTPDATHTDANCVLWNLPN